METGDSLAYKVLLVLKLHGFGLSGTHWLTQQCIVGLKCRQAGTVTVHSALLQNLLKLLIKRRF